MNLKQYIREVPDWPKPGINFYDVTTLMENPDAFRFAVDTLAGLFKYQQIDPVRSRTQTQASATSNGVDKVVGIDARGFLFAAPVAYQLGAGLSVVRKKGKLPYKTISKDYTLEYASNTIEMHEDTIKPGEKVVLIDDLIATGGTAVAAVELIEQMGGEIVGIGFLVDLPFLGGSKKLKQYKTYSLIQYHGE